MTLSERVKVMKEQKMINDGGINQEQLPIIALSTLSTLLNVNRTSLYYSKQQPSTEEIAIKNRIDQLHTDNPTWGQRLLRDILRLEGFNIGRRKVRRYMEEMAIRATYPKPNLSKGAKGHQVYPYLLKYFIATRPNQAWSIDITYIRLNHGFIYLTAIIDWYSRMIVGWELDDTLETGMVIRALRKAFAVATPEVLNSDQGSQFTSHDYVSYIGTQWDVTISMDGVGRWADNIMIERWFRTLKYDEVYLNQYESIKDARRQIGRYINNYNFNRPHSSIGRVPPASRYFPILLFPTSI